MRIENISRNEREWETGTDPISDDFRYQLSWIERIVELDGQPKSPERGGGIYPQNEEWLNFFSRSVDSDSPTQFSQLITYFNKRVEEKYNKKNEK